MSPPSKARGSGAGMKVDETVLLVPLDGQDSEHVVKSEIAGPLISDAFESRTLGLARLNESGRLESVAETDWAELRVEVWAEIHEEVRTDASEGDVEDWCEVSDETMLLGSKEEHGVEHVVGFETDCSETNAEVWADGLEDTADGLEGAEPEET